VIANTPPSQTRALSARASLNVILTPARPLLTPFEHRSYQGLVQ
jgi:hypothetical protein